jgi:exopolysaccharide biosynthesis polyprenyl glycosylphosphotransferase
MLGAKVTQGASMAATPVEQVAPTALPPGQSSRFAAKSPDVEGRLLQRRRRNRSLRRLLVHTDALTTLGIVALALAADSEVAAGMALAVYLAVTAHVCAADSPRTVVAVRSVLRLAMLLSGIACVAAAVIGSRPAGREVLLGVAGSSVAMTAVRVVLRAPRLASRVGLGHRRRLIVGDPAALEATAARRAPAVEAGEVILVVTRAERAHAEAAGGSSTSLPAGADQRRERQDGAGPTGVVERVVRTALDNGAERVTVVPGDSWGQVQLRELSWLLEGTGIDMVISTNLHGIAPHRVDVVQQDGRLMIKVGSANPRGTRALVKGTLDRVAAVVLLVLSAPVLVAIAAAVRIESTGPAIFRQTRVRGGGGTFTMYKFRTMTTDAEAQLMALQDMNMHGAGQTLFKLENDPRITRVGGLLRKTSLDELPQLVNVLKGQMSLIGPRPALPREVEKYDYVARRRLAVKPGMTGLWQVSGRSNLPWDEAVRLDLYYVENWSMFADTAILAKTLKAVLGSDGAV